MNGPEVEGLPLFDVSLILCSEDLWFLEDFDEIGLGVRGEYFFEALKFSEFLGVGLFLIKVTNFFCLCKLVVFKPDKGHQKKGIILGRELEVIT